MVEIRLSATANVQRYFSLPPRQLEMALSCLAAIVLLFAAFTLPAAAENTELSEDSLSTSVPTPAAISGAKGTALFAQQCIFCHGIDARGVEQMGVTLVASKFVASSSTDELASFLMLGRLPTDPASISGLAMPGFAYLGENNLRAIAVHLRNIVQ